MFHLTIAASAMDMNDVVDAFNSDFERPSPERLVGRLASVVQHVSGLRATSDIPVKRKSPGDLRAARDASYKNIENASGGDDIDGLVYALSRHGLDDGNREDNHGIFGIEFEDVLAFYNPDAKEIVLIEGLTSAEIEGVLLHELVHAAQDQHVPLRRFFAERGASIDGHLATASVVEGQAQALDYLIWISENPDSDRIGLMMEQFNERLERGFADLGGEDFASRLRTFPYYYGMNLVLNSYVSDGTKSFEAMLRRAPTTTEQVLHRDKLRSREPPVITVLERRLDAGSLGNDVVFSTSLGEFYVREMFAGQPDGGRETAARAAAGWGGDFVVVLGPKESMTLVWDTMWDNGTDAEEFFESYRQLREGMLNVEVAAGDPSFEAEIPGEVYIHRKGRRVVIFEGSWSASELAEIAGRLDL